MQNQGEMRSDGEARAVLPRKERRIVPEDTEITFWGTVGFQLAPLVIPYSRFTEMTGLHAITKGDSELPYRHASRACHFR